MARRVLDIAWRRRVGLPLPGGNGVIAMINLNASVALKRVLGRFRKVGDLVSRVSQLSRKKKTEGA